jgi:hypothetical protein
MNKQQPYFLIRDASIVALGVLLAIFLVKDESFNAFIISLGAFKYFGSFISGIFFTSIFTAAPATAVLAEIARYHSSFWSAFFGGLGALLGDMVIFRFARNNIREDIFYLARKIGLERLTKIFSHPFLGWVVPVLGAIIIASPLPDELGLLMLGISKISTQAFVPLSFLLNFLGIFIIGIVAKSL